MKKSNDWSPILDENGAIAQQWMVGSIDVALQRINEWLTKRDVIPRAHVIDPGAYNAIRCTPEGAFELRYTFKYGWCDFAISDVKGLTADAEIDWKTVEPQIAAMGIARQNIEDAIAKRDKPVTLYAGARTRSGGVEGQERIAYPQASDGLDEDKEGDAEARKIRIAAEKVRKKSNDAIDKLGGMLGQMDTDDPEEQRAAAERIKEQIKQQEDFWDGFGVVEMDLDFTNDDGEFDQGKYDAFRDIVAESYAQQMKRLKASTRLLKRLRKDKTRIELPKLPGWQYLPGDRRIWTDPHAVSAEVAYPKDGFVSQGGPQSVFGFGR